MTGHMYGPFAGGMTAVTSGEANDTQPKTRQVNPVIGPFVYPNIPPFIPKLQSYYYS
jgi:hypothetical protein